MLNGERIGTVYGYDLTGAGAGAALVLVLMFLLHRSRCRRRCWYRSPWPPAPRAADCWHACRAARREILLLGFPQAEYNDFKAIYAPMHTPDAKQAAEIRSPRGLYALLDDFTERVDTDLSNNAGMLGVPGPPQSFGLYRDGSRVAALPKPGATGAEYAPAELDALPYALAPKGKVLLRGASGGFAIGQALALGAADHHRARARSGAARRHRPWSRSGAGVGRRPAGASLGRQPAGDLRTLRPGRHLGDFLDAGEANATSFSEEAIEAYLRALQPDGVISIPVSIREFPVYAVRVLATVRDALLASGITDPARQVVVYRSAWNVRILVTKTPWTAAQIAEIRKFCDDARSTSRTIQGSTSPPRARTSTTTFRRSTSRTASREQRLGQDAVADEAELVLRGQTSPSQQAFDLRPITLDRPFYYAILRLGRLPQILSRLEILPQQEVGQLVNVAVLAQSAVLAPAGAGGSAIRAAGGAGGRRHGAGRQGDHLLRPVSAWAFSASRSS